MSMVHCVSPRDRALHRLRRLVHLHACELHCFHAGGVRRPKHAHESGLSPVLLRDAQGAEFSLHACATGLTYMRSKLKKVACVIGISAIHGAKCASRCTELVAKCVAKGAKCVADGVAKCATSVAKYFAKGTTANGKCYRSWCYVVYSVVIVRELITQKAQVLNMKWC